MEVGGEARMEDVLQSIRDKVAATVKASAHIDTSDYFSQICGLELIEDGSILVVGLMAKKDSEPCFLKCSTTGDIVEAIPYDITTPDQVAIWEDRIFIGDGDQMIVKELDLDGVLQRVFTCPHELDGGIGVAINAEGLYMTSTSSKTVYHCHFDSDMATEWGDPEAELKAPSHVTCSPDGNVIITDNKGHCIHVFDNEGSLRFTFGTKGEGNGQLCLPWEVCTDADDRIYVADFGNDRISVLSGKGKFLTNLVTCQDHKVFRPRCVTLTPDSKEMIVAHRENQITIFKPSL